MSSSIRTFAAQLAVETSTFLGDRIQMFWAVFFPVLVIAILGFAFGTQSFSGHRNLETGHYVDALIAGIMGTNLMAMALFNIGASLSQYREQALLQRLVVGRVSLVAVLIGMLAHRYVLVVFQIAVMMLVAHMLFGYLPPENQVAFGSILSLGVVTFTALGFTFALLVKSSNQAMVLGNVTYLPLAFLSGAYFPVDHLPGQQLFHVLPSAALIDALRLANGVDAAALLHTFPLYILTAWAAILVGTSVGLRSRLGQGVRV